MTTASRKEREREAREGLILDVAERLLAARGYLGMNMDQIAQETEYSKGTIYQHFSCKEEVLIALTDRMAAERVAYFQRAATFRGLSRERMAAVGLSLDLFFALNPHHFVIEQIVTADSIRDKTSESRRLALQEKEGACMGVVTGIVRDAVAQGDLAMPEGVTAEGIVYGLWITTAGGMSMMIGKPDLRHLGFGDPAEALQRTQNAILDGYGWRPLTGEHDYEASRQRALVEVFPDEARRAGLL
jgi:AcrR family transcriptional regulator